MTTPIYSLADWAAAQASPWNGQNSNARIVEALIRGSISDRDLAAPPGSCADGAAYLVAGSATGAWVGKSGQLAIAVGANAASGWLFAAVAKEGFQLWVDDENLRIMYDGAAWVEVAGSGAGSYDFGFAFEATPGASDIVGRVRIARNIIVAANMAGSYGGQDVNPAATFDVDVLDDGVSIGTISVATGGAVTFTTVSGTAKNVAAGSVVTFVAPVTPDTTIEGMSAVIAATIDL